MPDEANNIDEGPETDAANALRIGPLRVSAAHADIEAFCLATGWSSQVPHTKVPHTFPMRWLASPEIRGMLETKLQSAGGIAIHESQSFAYESPLEADQDYIMTAEIDQQANPQRLIVRALVATPHNRPCLRMETILRVVSAAGGGP